jgi:hypothetical protein
MRFLVNALKTVPVALAWIVVLCAWAIHLVVGQMLLMDNYLFNPPAVEARAQFTPWARIDPPEGDWDYRRLGEMDFGIYHARFAQVRQQDSSDIWYDRPWSQSRIEIVQWRLWVGLAISLGVLIAGTVVWVWLFERVRSKYVRSQ